ncbi:hypothetical protein BDV98DRAFT_569991 [Pterulicium gracile]|uniref:Uncharacterized protein n=1 Tax=Pterulicium gracile TaxID=1884261 RepID=A0A5C3QEI0_9AGAR|nr:hypothetical protein BDV98DRAFT_569991 [Pterula gracilis]
MTAQEVLETVCRMRRLDGNEQALVLRVIVECPIKDPTRLDSFNILVHLERTVTEIERAREGMWSANLDLVKRTLVDGLEWDFPGLGPVHEIPDGATDSNASLLDGVDLEAMRAKPDGGGSSLWS